MKAASTPLLYSYMKTKEKKKEKRKITEDIWFFISIITRWAILKQFPLQIAATMLQYDNYLGKKNYCCLH